MQYHFYTVLHPHHCTILILLMCAHVCYTSNREKTFKKIAVGLVTVLCGQTQPIGSGHVWPGQAGYRRAYDARLSLALNNLATFLILDIKTPSMPRVSGNISKCNESCMIFYTHMRSVGDAQCKTHHPGAARLLSICSHWHDWHAADLLAFVQQLCASY